MCQIAGCSKMAVAMSATLEGLMDLKNILHFLYSILSKEFVLHFDKECSGVLPRMSPSYLVLFWMS